MAPIIGYAAELLASRRREERYRTYVAESLRLIPQGMYIAQPYSDTQAGLRDIDADEIKERVIAGAGLEVIR